jgi:hypothetical protein
MKQNEITAAAARARAAELLETAADCERGSLEANPAGAAFWRTAAGDCRAKAQRLLRRAEELEAQAAVLAAATAAAEFRAYAKALPAFARRLHEEYVAGSGTGSGGAP